MSDEERPKVVLTDAVKPEAIRLGEKASDWREAVRLAGGALVDVGACGDDYVDAMIETVEELGPYIVLAPGVALPHARPEKGAKEVGVSCVVLETPVEFGAKNNDPVDLVFAFATPGKEAHTSVLQALATFLEDGDNLEALRNAKDVDEVLDLMTTK